MPQGHPPHHFSSPFPLHGLRLGSEIPPHVLVSDFVRRAKGRSWRKIQQELEHIHKSYWCQRFWQRGCFSTTSGNITDDIIMRYLDRQTHKNGLSPST